MKPKRNENTKKSKNPKGSPKNKTVVFFTNCPSYFLKYKKKIEIFESIYQSKKL